jgi:hypothetical protein
MWSATPAVVDLRDNSVVSLGPSVVVAKNGYEKSNQADSCSVDDVCTYLW